MLRLPAVTGGVLLLASVAFAHDPNGLPNWITNGRFLSPIDGSHCCGVNDCIEIPARDIMQTGVADYFIKPLQELVPAKEVQVSRDGAFWRCKKPDGSRRCFFAPPKSA